MGLHTGEGAVAADSYVGLDVHRAARVANSAHGGQVLISGATHALVDGALPDDIALKDLGVHRLKDLERPEHLYQLVIDGLPDEFPPIRTLDARRTNLPAERTSFVGRERLVAALVDLMREVRLLTLTGPGGTGKTRLALKVAAPPARPLHRRRVPRRPQSITDPRFVPAAVAQALQLREQPGRQPLRDIIDDVRERHLLLVMDNFEHLLEGAETVGTLLDAAPRISVLATSRIPSTSPGSRGFQSLHGLPDVGDVGD